MLSVSRGGRWCEEGLSVSRRKHSRAPLVWAAVLVGLTASRGMSDGDSVKFQDEGDGLLSCIPGPSNDGAVYSAFRSLSGASDSDELAEDARMLFKVTVDSNESSKHQKAKPVLFVAVPHTAPFQRAVALCNRRFCATATDPTGEGAQGAFILDGGFGLK